MARRFRLQARRATDDLDFAGDLNEEQLAVASAPGGPMLVVAGAGTGKTRALTYRLAWLAHSGVDLSRMMLVTFTNRAAREMLHRVELLIQKDTREIWGGTFHHIANRTLRRHGRLLGIDQDYSILDREDAKDLMKSCVTDAEIETTERRFPHKGLLVSISSFVQNTLDPLDRILAKRYPMFQDDVDNIAKVLDLYGRRKRQQQLLDYDDLLSEWLRLLEEHEQIRDMLAEQFQHVLVDEYQDTNAIQGRIIDLLAAKHRNLCVVGDDSQSIYSFRGASFENIITFKERYADARQFKLETNYRSTPEVLELANAIIERNTRRLPKALRAVRPSGLKPAVVTCHDHFVQVRFIAEYILHLHDEGHKFTDMAVLYRSHWHSLEIQLELQRRNIPFQVRGGLRFFEQAHIKDVLAHLRLVHNPRDEIAWMRVLPMLPRVGPVMSRRLWQHIENTENPLVAAGSQDARGLFRGAARNVYTKFADMMAELAKIASPAEMIERLMQLHYGDYLVSHYDGASLRREDINGLTNFAAQYNTLEGFLADIALAGEFSGETVVTGPDEWEFVVLSTVHQAKGLEWPIVFIPWLADGRFPTDMAINTQEDLEEERRVFHVAVTRAKDEVYLVMPQIYRSKGRGLVMMKPSRFLTELSKDVTEPMELEEGLPFLTTGAPSKETDVLTEGALGPEGPKALPPATED
ncbi:MAG: ATP-dependent helicase [Phycisphaerae bacterium]|nr:ATP-dependent helicase [Phycisphaerae bacterium]